MKKTTLLSLLFTLWWAGTWAQVGNPTIIDQQENLRQLATLGPLSPGARGFDNRYEGVRGSPLLFEDWREARIVVQGGTAEGEQAEININQYDNLLVVRFPGGQAGTVPVAKIRMLHVKTPAGTRTFESLPATMVENDSEEEKRFYEVLRQGKFTLLKAHEKIFQKADYKGAYSTDRRYDEFLDRQVYYLRGPDGPFEKLNKLKSKAIEKTLPGYEKEIGEIVNKEKLDLREERDVIRLIELLDN
jgi:hypothetical protein